MPTELVDFIEFMEQHGKNLFQKSDGKKLKVFKTEEGEWVVDMTQFADSAHSKTVSKQYRSLQYCD